MELKRDPKIKQRMNGTLYSKINSCLVFDGNKDNTTLLGETTAELHLSYPLLQHTSSEQVHSHAQKNCMFLSPPHQLPHYFSRYEQSIVQSRRSPWEVPQHSAFQCNHLEHKESQSCPGNIFSLIDILNTSQLFPPPLNGSIIARRNVGVRLFSPCLHKRVVLLM